MNTQLMGIMRTQKIIEQAEIRREHRNQEDNIKEKELKRSIFRLDNSTEVKSTYKAAKELRNEQVKDIMQCMQSQAINRMSKINEIAG